jgi:hypothetical protein
MNWFLRRLWYGGRCSSQVLGFVWMALYHTERKIKQARVLLMGRSLCVPCTGGGLIPSVQCPCGSSHGWQRCEHCQGWGWEPALDMGDVI